MSSRFVPTSWTLTEPLRQFAKDKGLTDKQIDEQEEIFRDVEFPKPRHDFNRCWRRFIRNSIKWGQVVIEHPVTYRQPEQVTKEQRKIYAEKAIAQMEAYRRAK